MKIILLAHTPEPDALVATAAHVCVSDDSVAGFYHELTAFRGISGEPDPVQFFNRPLSMGHTSILEHVSFTFGVEGVSRSLSHQLVRFRIASFSQQSQRYCRLNSSNFAYVVPPSIQAVGDGALSEWNTPNTLLEDFQEFMVHAVELYQKLVAGGIPAEDARFVLPNACETKLVMTMNARQILHACSLRECSHAQWEIRAMFNEVHRLVEQAAPSLFKDRLGPPCVVTGRCPEGSRSCGRIQGGV